MLPCFYFVHNQMRMGDMPLLSEAPVRVVGRYLFRSVSRWQVTRMNSGGIKSMSIEILTDKQVMDILGMARTTFWRLRQNGDFPPSVGHSHRMLRYRKSDVEAWLDQQAQKRRA